MAEADTPILRTLRHRYGDRTSRERLVMTAIILQAFLTLSLAGVGVISYWSRGPESRLFPTALSSPAGDAVTYHIHRFQSTVHDASVYQGTPNIELDTAWQNLYDFTPMTAGSWAISSEAADYSSDLAVFRSLRCLNKIRQAFYPQYYKDAIEFEPTSGWTAVDECFDFVRQSLMCMADVSTLVYVWDESFQRNVPNFESVHTCRDFERLQDWASAGTQG